MNEQKKENEHKKRELPEQPASLFPEAKEIWEQLAPVLFDMEVLEKVDFAVFAMMLNHYVIAMRAAAAIQEEGLTRRDENNVERKNPHLQILRDNSNTFRQYIKEFAITPKARQILNKEHYFKSGKNTSDILDILSNQKDI